MVVTEATASSETERKFNSNVHRDNECLLFRLRTTAEHIAALEIQGVKKSSIHCFYFSMVELFSYFLAILTIKLFQKNVLYHKILNECLRFFKPFV